MIVEGLAVRRVATVEPAAKEPTAASMVADDSAAAEMLAAVKATAGLAVED